MKFLNKVTDKELINFFGMAKRVFEGDNCTFSNININRDIYSVKVTEETKNYLASGVIFQDTNVVCCFEHTLTDAQKAFFNYEWRKFMCNKFNEEYVSFLYGEKGIEGLIDEKYDVMEKLTDESVKLAIAEKRLKNVTEKFNKFKEEYEKNKAVLSQYSNYNYYQEESDEPDLNF